MRWLLAAALLLAACGDNRPGPASGPSSSSPNATFTLCSGTYALCTQARCKPISGDATGQQLSCGCRTEVGYSAGTKSCAEVPQAAPAPGLKIPSRYAPVSSMAVCANSRPWAWCLDMPCTIDADTKHAACTCTQTTSPRQAYVVVVDSYDASTCTSDIWSSATVEDVLQITGFLQGSKDLPPSPITIIGVDAGQP